MIDNSLKDKKSTTSKKSSKLFVQSRQVLNYLYLAYQNSYKHRKLLKGFVFFLKKQQMLTRQQSRLLVRKQESFLYKINTDEQEFKRRKKTVKIDHYLTKLKFRRFYGNLRRRNFKRVFKEKGLTDNFLGRSFAFFIESRIDVLLYRANFFESIFTIKQYINHKKIFVNGFVESKPSFKISMNDFVCLPNFKRVYLDIKNRLLTRRLLGNYPSYLEINYKVGVILAVTIPTVKEVPYPFFMKLENVAHSFLK